MEFNSGFKGLMLIFFPVALGPNAGHGILILEVFKITHNDAPQTVGLLWASDQLVAEIIGILAPSIHNRFETLNGGSEWCRGWRAS